MTRPLEVITPAACEALLPPDYIVKGLIARGNHVELIGQPGAGKSVLAPHIAYAVAQGRQILGRRVRQGVVLYVAVEDGMGMIKRVRALRERWGDAPNFYMVPDSIDLLRGAVDIDRLEIVIAELQPALVIIDTLARAFPGLAENDADAMGQVIRVVRGLIAVCGSAVIMVHHVTKDGGETPRGHGSLNADADVTMIVQGSGSDTRTVKLGKNRNGGSDQTFSFDLQVQVLGIDDDSDPITAPIAHEAEASPFSASKAREAKLRDKPRDMLREMRNAAACHGDPIKPEIGMPPVTAITRALFRTILIDRGWFDDSLLLRSASGAISLDRSGFPKENAALTTLKNGGFLCFNREWVWLL
jgi:hypothetical protein